MEHFFRTLDGPGQPEISKLLEKRGPLQGKQSSTFQQGWNFFKRREMLGLELPAPLPKPKPSKLPREVQGLMELREVDPNRGKKRAGLDNGERSGKQQKRSRS
ncbi:hypothetical protein F5Y19DRAFT_478540 [Xylariaceae sp. FL1651]|nr:hypothetical protein F5Y19DRAFT_478540 [Xylariaceae sp. FL1651]